MSSTKIIRTPDQIADASTEVLLASYNALTGESVKRFATRAAGERRLEMAMLAAADRTAHAGVPKGTTKITPKTAKELGFKPPKAKVEAEAPAEVADGSCVESSAEARHATADWGGMCQALSSNCVKDVAPPKPAPLRRDKMVWVRATDNGTSKLQAKSVRAAVMAAIVESPLRLARIEDLEVRFLGHARSHVQKLLAKSHVIVLTEEEAQAILEGESK